MTGKWRKKTDGPRNKIVNEDWWQRLVREMYLHMSHSLFNPPSFTSAQSPSITGQLYPPMCAALVSFFHPLLCSYLWYHWKNDKTGTTAELSVPYTMGRKLPSFPFHMAPAEAPYSFSGIHITLCCTWWNYLCNLFWIKKETCEWGLTDSFQILYLSVFSFLIDI